MAHLYQDTFFVNQSALRLPFRNWELQNAFLQIFFAPLHIQIIQEWPQATVAPNPYQVRVNLAVVQLRECPEFVCGLCFGNSRTPYDFTCKYLATPCVIYLVNERKKYKNAPCRLLLYFLDLSSSHTETRSYLLLPTGRGCQVMA